MNTWLASRPSCRAAAISILTLAVGTGLAACAGAPGVTTSASAGAGETPAQAHARLVEAYSSCNEAAFLAVYAPYFAFTTSNTKAAVHTADGLRAYLGAGCRSRPNPTATLVQQSVRVQGPVATLVGQYRFKVPAGSQLVEVLQNFTLLMERAGERWLISAHHVSVAP
jgi:hypothetical protein